MKRRVITAIAAVTLSVLAGGGILHFKRLSPVGAAVPVGVRSLADLVRKAEALGVSQTRGNTEQT